MGRKGNSLHHCNMEKVAISMKSSNNTYLLRKKYSIADPNLLPYVSSYPWFQWMTSQKKTTLFIFKTRHCFCYFYRGLLPPNPRCATQIYFFFCARTYFWLKKSYIFFIFHRCQIWAYNMYIRVRYTALYQGLSAMTTKIIIMTFWHGQVK